MAGMDRSLAFTALLELHPTFSRMTDREAQPLVTELVEAWQRDCPRDRYAHARQWIEQRR